MKKIMFVNNSSFAKDLANREADKLRWGIAHEARWVSACPCEQYARY